MNRLLRIAGVVFGCVLPVWNVCDAKAQGGAEAEILAEVQTQLDALACSPVDFNDQGDVLLCCEETVACRTYALWRRGAALGPVRLPSRAELNGSGPERVFDITTLANDGTLIGKITELEITSTEDEEVSSVRSKDLVGCLLKDADERYFPIGEDVRITASRNGEYVLVANRDTDASDSPKDRLRILRNLDSFELTDVPSEIFVNEGAPNNAGIVAGTASAGSVTGLFYAAFAFEWSQERFALKPPLGRPEFSDVRFARANNGLDVVLSYGPDSSGSKVEQSAVIWRDGTIQKIEYGPPGSINQAVAINDNGLVLTQYASTTDLDQPIVESGSLFFSRSRGVLSAEEALVSVVPSGARVDVVALNNRDQVLAYVDERLLIVQLRGW
ncbi:MAG: hypothetical protein KDD69_11610 [Bdellovibrionales bacterium]|nr:hypothetical protein [Bdellovibrionales bacterium]